MYLHQPLFMSQDDNSTVGKPDGNKSKLESEPPSPNHDEAFCTECGEIIKKQAEICPECGVRQKSDQRKESVQQVQQTQQGNNSLTDKRQYELEKKAGADKTVTILLAVFLTPFGYWVIDEKLLAVVNFLTFNYFLLGPVVVPIHCHLKIENAKQELRAAGIGSY